MTKQKYMRQSDVNKLTESNIIRLQSLQTLLLQAHDAPYAVFHGSLQTERAAESELGVGEDDGKKFSDVRIVLAHEVAGDT